ncbi:MAG: hypothetical protein A2Y02_01450 [Omnitrophica bacterium GWA2_52_12]|nr:MAG: hypothetical protein A2Y02_01450 [Omnitrophica bacterium GWA2_52_12]
MLSGGLGLLAFGACFFFGASQSRDAAALYALIFLAGFIYSRRLTFPKFLPRRLIPAGGLFFTLLLGVSLFAAYDPWQSLLRLTGWFAMGVVFMLSSGLDQKERENLLAALVLTALFQTGYGIFALSGTPEKILWRMKEDHLGYLTGTYLNRNHLAGMLELALGAAMGFFLKESTAKKNGMAMFWALIFCLLFGGLMLTGSRAGLLCWLMGFITSLSIFSGGRSGLRTPALWILLGIVFVAAWPLCGSLLSRFEPDAGYLALQNGRLWAWQDGLVMLKDHLVLGTGLGNFGALFPAYQSARLQLGWEHIHCDYLELAIELGLPLWGAGLALAGAVIRVLIKQTVFMPPSLQALQTGCFAGLFALLFHGFFDFNFAVPANVLNAVLMAGILCGTLNTRVSES